MLLLLLAIVEVLEEVLALMLLLLLLLLAHVAVVVVVLIVVVVCDIRQDATGVIPTGIHIPLSAGHHHAIVELLLLLLLLGGVDLPTSLEHVLLIGCGLLAMWGGTTSQPICRAGGLIHSAAPITRARWM